MSLRSHSGISHKMWLLIYLRHRYAQDAAPPSRWDRFATLVVGFASLIALTALAVALVIVLFALVVALMT